MTTTTTVLGEARLPLSPMSLQLLADAEDALTIAQLRYETALQATLATYQEVPINFRRLERGTQPAIVVARELEAMHADDVGEAPVDGFDIAPPKAPNDSPTRETP